MTWYAGTSPYDEKRDHSKTAAAPDSCNDITSPGLRTRFKTTPRLIVLATPDRRSTRSFRHLWNPNVTTLHGARLSSPTLHPEFLPFHREIETPEQQLQKCRLFLSDTICALAVALAIRGNCRR